MNKIFTFLKQQSKEANATDLLNIIFSSGNLGEAIALKLEFDKQFNEAIAQRKSELLTDLKHISDYETI